MEELAADDLLILRRALNVLAIRTMKQCHLQNEHVCVLPLVLPVDVGAASDKRLHRCLLHGVRYVDECASKNGKEHRGDQLDAFLVGVIKIELGMNGRSGAHLRDVFKLVQNDGSNVVVSVVDQRAQNGNDRPTHAEELVLLAAVLDSLNEVVPTLHSI